MVAPSKLPVTLDEVKAQARVQQDWEDALFWGWIAAVTEVAQNRLSRQLITATRRTIWDGPPIWSWERGDYSLPIGRSPVQSITSVSYIDSDGATQVLSSAVYRLAHSQGPVARIVVNYNEVFPEVQLRGESVWADYVCGYGDNWSDVPEPIRQWIILQCATRTEFREALTAGQVSALPPDFTDGLLAPYEVVTF